MNTAKMLPRRVGVGLGLAGMLALGGSLLGAGNAMAAGCGANCAQASINIPQSFTFAMNTASLPFTGSAGGPSNVVTASWTATTNDSSGYKVQVATSSASFVNGANTFPVSDVDTFGGSALNSAAGTPGCDVLNGAASSGDPLNGQCNFPEPLSTTALTVANSTSVSAGGGDNGTDSYAFLGSGYSYSPGAHGPFAGQTSHGSNIPGNVPAGTYVANVQYTGLAN